MRLLPALALVLVLVAQEASSVLIFSAISGVLGTASSIKGFVDSFLTDDSTTELLHRFDTVTGRIQAIEQMVLSISLGPLKNLDQNVGRQISWQLTLDDMEDLLQQVDNKYDRFLLYQKKRDSIEKSTLEDFADEAISHDTKSLHSTIYSLRDLALGGSGGSTGRRKRSAFKQGLFRILKSMLQETKTTVCGLQHSPQQLALVLYGTLAKAMTKNFAMVQFSYKLLRLLGKGSYTTEENHFSDSFNNISMAVAREASSVMEGLSTDFWRCDPSQHKRGVTYEEVTQLLQGHIEGEVDVNGRGSCIGKCHDHHNIRTSRCYGAGASWDPLCQNQRRCRGTLYNCKEIDAEATICLADSNSPRRYNWVRYSGGQTLGKDDGSHGRCYKTHHVEKWRSWFVHCSYCLCYCDDPSKSNRYFSLKPAVSDISENKIVTGIRFILSNKIFHIQLQQGVADRTGNVLSSTVKWKAVNYFHYLRDDTDRDLYELTYTKRCVVLRELKAPQDHVVTGVSFHKLRSGYLSFKVQMTAISAGGVLDSSSSYWVRDTGSGSIPRLKLGSSPTPSTMLAVPSWPSSRSRHSVHFVPSSIATDAAQTTLPLLDIQDVAPWPPTRLTGVGLYHKGQRGGGGFIGLSVTTADQTM